MCITSAPWRAPTGSRSPPAPPVRTRVPGDHRADGVLDDAAVLAAMLRVEETWLAALVVHDVAPAAAALPRRGGLASALEARAH